MSWKNLIPQLPEPPQHTPEPDFRSATCLISPATSLVNYERSAQEVARLYNIIIDRDFEEDCKGNYYGRDSMKNERLALSLNKAVMKAATLNILYWAITPPHRGGLPPEITAIISEMIFAPEHGVEEEECMSQARLSVPEKEPDNPFRSSLNESLQVSLEDIHAPSPDIIEPETTSFVPRFQQFTSRLKQESFQESLPISGKSSRKRKAVLEQEDLGEPSIEQRFTYECDKGRPDGDTRPLKRTRSCDGLWNPQWHAKRQKTPQGGEINGLFPAAAFSRFKFKKAVRLATSHSNPKEGSDNEDDANDDIRPYSDSLNSSSDEDLPFDTTQLLNGLLA